jgi:hypothetical protein
MLFIFVRRNGIASTLKDRREVQIFLRSGLLNDPCRRAQDTVLAAVILISSMIPVRAS